MDFMAEAARLAAEGVRARSGGPFGAVVVKAGRIVGAACNRVLERNDPTAHAEMEAIRAACAELGGPHLDGCEIYTTCEPCPMCLAAIHWAHLGCVHYALTRRDAARLGFLDEELHDAIANPRVAMLREACPAAEAAVRLWESLPDREVY
jgi:tRNA(Arg) A34 adenosine deaminase TadA